MGASPPWQIRLPAALARIALLVAAAWLLTACVTWETYPTGAYLRGSTVSVRYSVCRGAPVLVLLLPGRAPAFGRDHPELPWAEIAAARASRDILIYCIDPQAKWAPSSGQRCDWQASDTRSTVRLGPLSRETLRQLRRGGGQVVTCIGEVNRDGEIGGRYFRLPVQTVSRGWILCGVELALLLVGVIAVAIVWRRFTPAAAAHPVSGGR